MIVTYVNADWTEKEVELSWLRKDNITYYDWKYYDIHLNCVTRCIHCEKLIHKNLTYQWYCLKCARQNNPNVIYCMDCKHLHIEHSPCYLLEDIKDINTEIVSFGESIRISTEGHDFSARWEQRQNNIVKTIWQFQSERELPDNIYNSIKEFYHWSNIFKHYYYWWDYKIEWDVSYLNVNRFKDILYRLKDIKCSIEEIRYWHKLSPYRNYNLVWITDDWMLEWAKYDLMWKEKHWTEKPNNFLQSLNIPIDNKEARLELHYVLSSDLEHKLLAFKSNPKFGSCQKSSNSESYSKWAYDAITNGCNLPILIYKQWSKQPMWRITCRVMYDKDGKEYLLLERLYHDWTLGDCDVRWKMYAKIAHDLKSKWYNVIASNYSAHDSSTYSYLAKYWLSSNTLVEDLVQPLRQLPNGCGYYCDGWTEVYHYEIDWIDWATDYLDKAYLI